MSTFTSKYNLCHVMKYEIFPPTVNKTGPSITSLHFTFDFDFDYVLNYDTIPNVVF